MTFDWHKRFVQQSLWTRPLREYLCRDLTITQSSLVLEVGSGTGVIASDFYNDFPSKLFGIDMDLFRCVMATRLFKNIAFQNGDAYQLPYASNTFDLVFCHYFLLWITSPVTVLQEILRVLKPGGRFLAFAEPDYAARIDAPTQLESLGFLQTSSLIDQGANPRIGRNLPALVAAAGFCQSQYGISSYEQTGGDLPEWWESEWQVIAEDLESFVDNEELASIKRIDHANWLSGTRVLWIPTFYLSCIKPQ